MYLPGAGKKMQTFDTVTEMHPLCIFQNFYLPVSFEKQQFFEYTYETVTLTEEEASAMAEKDLYDFLNKMNIWKSASQMHSFCRFCRQIYSYLEKI